MRIVQMTLDEKLVSEIDKTVKELGTTRSAFTRDALKSALKQLLMKELEKKHREGYRKKPAKEGEFSDFENEQVWVD